MNEIKASINKKFINPIPTKNKEKFEIENSLFVNNFNGNIGFSLFFSMIKNNIKPMSESIKRNIKYIVLKWFIFTCMSAYTSKHSADAEVIIPAQSILELAA